MLSVSLRELNYISEGINLHLSKDLRFDKAPDQQLSGFQPCWNNCREEEIEVPSNPILHMQRERLISTDLILGHVAPGHPNAVVTLYEKKKVLDAGIASEEVEGRQISFPFNCGDKFGFNLTHIVCSMEEIDDSDYFDDFDDGLSREIFVKDFGLSSGQCQPDEVNQ